MYYTYRLFSADGNPISNYGSCFGSWAEAVTLAKLKLGSCFFADHAVIYNGDTDEVLAVVGYFK